MSLIEQIKKKASLLAETKMIDKVSIASSNYDDYDLNHMNCNTSVLDSQSINDQDGGSESGESANRILQDADSGNGGGVDCEAVGSGEQHQQQQQTALKFNE